MIEPVLKQDWQHWKLDPVTKKFLHDVNALRENYKEGLAEGAYGDQIQLYQGMCQALRDVIEYASHTFEVVEDPQEETKDVEAD